MKKPKGVKLWTKVGKGGRLVGEEWVTCRAFAEYVGCHYMTVLRWMRAKQIPCLEIPTYSKGGKPPGWSVCLTPFDRALVLYRGMLKSGELYPVARRRRRLSSRH